MEFRAKGENPSMAGQVETEEAAQEDVLGGSVKPKTLESSTSSEAPVRAIAEKLGAI